jgi:hypothetical protein
VGVVPPHSTLVSAILSCVGPPWWIVEVVLVLSITLLGAGPLQLQEVVFSKSDIGSVVQCDDGPYWSVEVVLNDSRHGLRTPGNSLVLHK